MDELEKFLPMLLGKRVVAENNLTETEGYWYGYDPNAHTSPSQAFTTAAFRYGHTFIQGKVMRYGRHHQFLGAHSLRFLLRHPFIIYEPGRIDELAMGLVDTPSQTYDPFISKEVAGHLFQEPWDHVGLDLPSINLMRGREQGTPGYNFYREWCGMRRAETFEELIPWVGNHTAYLYSTLYAHPDDIDLWSGGISEEKMPGALVGPTFGCIIARNFANIRKGDRFWFENPGFPSSFTLPQLREIRKATQSKILCDNGDRILTIQRWALRQAHPIHNPRVPCEQIPSIDLRVFKEDPDSGGFGDQNYGNGGSGTNAIDYR
ncbi:PREDICTED: thyroid peroxidase-like [Rhagoletis zephyria]|uniref:thyroid peroxidase-like n=1 Tax=Rhagoletis zephyria TaxID=28612 RepID=UPI00081196B6|nr:PREDICTED: thyroid peroxidase-like [Rhagoletis zephyria]